MTGTDELRKLLDERGVEYRIECKQTRATFEPFNRFIVLNERGGLRGTIDVYLDGACNCTWQFDGLTPEQAIAATLGRGTCTVTHDFNCSNCGKQIGAVRNCEMYETCDGQQAWKSLDHKVCDVPNYCPNCGAKVVER